MNLTQRPIYQKTPKAEKAPRKRMRPVSKKRARKHASPEGREGLAHMGRVKMQACAICGAPPPSDAHHCKDMPPLKLQWIYESLPSAGSKSGPRDCIPLCKKHHQDGPEAYHFSPASFREANGPDYGFILAARAAADAMIGEIDF